nr:unnamed protein product [Spirometra erinaceieuropaei]
MPRKNPPDFNFDWESRKFEPSPKSEIVPYVRRFEGFDRLSPNQVLAALTCILLTTRYLLENVFSTKVLQGHLEEIPSVASFKRNHRIAGPTSYAAP